MNKYMRTKRFNKYCRYESRVAERKSKKEFRQYCTIILILLLCVVFYAIYIHFWQGKATTIEDQTYTETYTEAYTEHLVKPNETLWQIAEQYHPNEDTRKVVYEIRKANADETGEKLNPKILPGQMVRVPIDLPSRQGSRQSEKRSVNEEWLTNEWLTMEATAYCACQK